MKGGMQQQHDTGQLYQSINAQTTITPRDHIYQLTEKQQYTAAIQSHYDSLIAAGVGTPHPPNGGNKVSNRYSQQIYVNTSRSPNPAPHLRNSSHKVELTPPPPIPAPQKYDLTLSNYNVKQVKEHNTSMYGMSLNQAGGATKRYNLTTNPQQQQLFQPVLKQSYAENQASSVSVYNNNPSHSQLNSDLASTMYPFTKTSSKGQNLVKQRNQFLPQQSATHRQPSQDNSNEDQKQNATLPEVSPKFYSSSIPVSTVQVVGNNQLQNNGLGAGRSLSQKTWSLINKNIKGIDESQVSNPPILSQKQLMITAASQAMERSNNNTSNNNNQLMMNTLSAISDFQSIGTSNQQLLSDIKNLDKRALNLGYQGIISNENTSSMVIIGTGNNQASRYQLISTNPHQHMQLSDHCTSLESLARQTLSSIKQQNHQESSPSVNYIVNNTIRQQEMSNIINKVQQQSNMDVGRDERQSSKTARGGGGAGFESKRKSQVSMYHNPSIQTQEQIEEAKYQQNHAFQILTASTMVTGTKTKFFSASKKLTEALNLEPEKAILQQLDPENANLQSLVQKSLKMPLSTSPQKQNQAKRNLYQEGFGGNGHGTIFIPQGKEEALIFGQQISINTAGGAPPSHAFNSDGANTERKKQLPQLSKSPAKVSIKMIPETPMKITAISDTAKQQTERNRFFLDQILSDGSIDQQRLFERQQVAPVAQSMDFAHGFSSQRQKQLEQLMPLSLAPKEQNLPNKIVKIFNTNNAKRQQLQQEIQQPEQNFQLPKLESQIEESFDRRSKSKQGYGLGSDPHRMGGPDPPHIAVKKLIMDQQVRNSAIFSIPLINLGVSSQSTVAGGAGLGQGNQINGITLSGQRLVSHNNFKAFQQIGGGAGGMKINRTSRIFKLSQKQQKNEAMGATQVKHRDTMITADQQQQQTQRFNHNLMMPGSVPHYLNPLDVNGNLLDQFGELDPVLAGQLRMKNTKLFGHMAFDSIDQSQITPMISRMKIFKSEKAHPPFNFKHQQLQQEALNSASVDDLNMSQAGDNNLLGMSIVHEISVDMPMIQPAASSPEKKNKFKSAAKKILTQQQTVSHFVTAKAAKQLPLKGLPSEGVFDSEKFIGQFNKTVDLVNEYINLTLKNKNSLNPQQGKRFLKLIHQLHISPLMTVHYHHLLTRMEELNRFIRTKEFLNISKGYLSRTLNQVVTSSFTQECLDMIRMHPYVNPATGEPNTSLLPYKFFVDTTGNNNQLVKSILKRRNWLTFSNDPLMPNFEQVHIIWTQWKKTPIVSALRSHQIYNKIEGNYLLTNKYYLLSTMRDYYHRFGTTTNAGAADDNQKSYLDVMPLTFRMNIDRKSGTQGNGGYQKFTKAFDELMEQEGQSVWIVKPGENSNRGRGIQIFEDLDQIREFVETTTREDVTHNMTKFVIQKYITNPLLIERRKFDLRVFGVAQLLNGPNNTREFRGYFFKEGYLRTSSREFSMNDLENRYVHLTNDAIQKKSADYGKFETGNKISYDDFSEILKTLKGVDFYKNIVPQIKQGISDTMEALANILEDQTPQQEPNNGCLNNCFELFGYDFMMTDDLKLQLIEVNTNPCLETESCPLLSRLIAQVVDQTFKVTVDPFFDGNEFDIGQSQEYPCSELKMEMIVCRQLTLTKPGEDERTQQWENSQHMNAASIDEEIYDEPTKSEKGDLEFDEDEEQQQDQQQQEEVEAMIEGEQINNCGQDDTNGSLGIDMTPHS